MQFVQKQGILHFFEDKLKRILHFFEDKLKGILHFFEDKGGNTPYVRHIKKKNILYK